MIRSGSRRRRVLPPPESALKDPTWIRAETTANPQAATPVHLRRDDDGYGRRPVSGRRPVVQSRPRAGSLVASMSAAANSDPRGLVDAHRREGVRAPDRKSVV